MSAKEADGLAKALEDAGMDTKKVTLMAELLGLGKNLCTQQDWLSWVKKLY